jgi:hypothetical protein
VPGGPLALIATPLAVATATTMADDLYIAADERARDARRAGLQAKKDEQPPNTARSYASKQREWKVRLPARPLRGLLLSAASPCLLS